MIQIKKTILTLVALLAVTTGAWAADPEFHLVVDGTKATLKYEVLQSHASSIYYDDGSWTNGSLSTYTEITVDASCSNFNGTSLKSLFKNFTKVTAINGLENLNTANVQDMSEMFKVCSKLTSLDLSTWDTGNVTNMKEMFRGCQALEEIIIGAGWSIAAVTNGTDMFNGCTHLPGANTATVRDHTMAKPTTEGGFLTYNAPAGTVTVDWNKATKTGTFSMPGGNVELEPEYYPQAALTAVPTAINDVPATTDGAILKAGTVATIGSTEQAQGTVMYYVSPTALDDAALLALAADQWKADVPTAESLAQGQAYVYYYVRGNDSDTDDETFSDGDILAANALTVTIAAAPTYAVTFAEGTPEPDKWSAQPNSDVTKGQTVTVTYTGTKKVLGVKAEKKAAPAGPKTYTELKGGEVLQVGDILDFSDANVEYIFSSYSLSQSYGPYTVLRANITGEKPHLTVTPADDGEYYVIKDKDGDYSFRNKSLPATATSDGILITINSEDGNVRICSASVHEP